MKISQREARRLKKRVAELEKVIMDQQHAWIEDWPMGTHIVSADVPADLFAKVSTARKLRHAVVVTTITDKGLAFIAMRLPEQD